MKIDSLLCSFNYQATSKQSFHHYHSVVKTNISQTSEVTENIRQISLLALLHATKSKNKIKKWAILSKNGHLELFKRASWGECLDLGHWWSNMAWRILQSDKIYSLYLWLSVHHFEGLYMHTTGNLSIFSCRLHTAKSYQCGWLLLRYYYRFQIH
jgi:hypothetical protein